MLTVQEVFDKVVTHLRKQGRKSRSDDAVASGNPYGCLYRGVDEIGPTMCGAGCLIEDEYYHPSLEGKGCTSDDVSKALIKSGVDMSSDNIVCVVNYLQDNHDGTLVESWEDNFKMIANFRGLKYVERC